MLCQQAGDKDPPEANAAKETFGLVAEPRMIGILLSVYYVSLREFV